MIKEFEVEDEGAPLEEKVAKAKHTVWGKPIAKDIKMLREGPKSP